MLRTLLTESWGLRYPLIGAPMANVSLGKLARAVSDAGALGSIGIGAADPVSRIAEEAAIARGSDGGRFGIGAMVWALERRPELFEAMLAEHPFLLSLSFGDPAPYVARVRAAGALVAAPVQTRTDALEAEAAGVDLIVVQGTEAGGHTGTVGTLPLLQIVLDAVATRSSSPAASRRHVALRRSSPPGRKARGSGRRCSPRRSPPLPPKRVTPRSRRARTRPC
jgi:nitronate monooxygenase